MMNRNHAAHQQMKTAAKKAGLLGFRACGKTELSLIAEPAAAALATYVDAGIKANPIMKVQLTFITQRNYGLPIWNFRLAILL